MLNFGEHMSFKEGDYIKIEYSAWRGSDKQLVFTTDEKLAKDNGIYNEKSSYKPQLVILGKKGTIKGLETVLMGMSVGEEKKTELEPKDAFGERNPELSRVMHLSDFRKRDMDPYPGMQVDIDGTVATVKSINSGRVLVDANHPLAGERMIYEVKVVEKIEDKKKMVEALANDYSLFPDAVDVESEKARFVFSAKQKKDPDYFINKTSAIGSIFDNIKDLRKVEVVEEYEREEKSKQ